MEQTTFNIVLSERRYELGLTVGQVAQDLQLPREVLFAIENGDYERLPSEEEAVEAISAYAQYVGLDPVSILASYEQGREAHRLASMPAPEPQFETDVTPEADEAGRPHHHSRRTLVVAIVALVMVLAGAGVAAYMLIGANSAQSQGQNEEQGQQQDATDIISNSAAPEPGRQKEEIVAEPPAPVDPAVDENMTAQAQGRESDTEWLLMVDCANNRMGIYRGEKDAWENQEFIAVSCGAEGGQDTIRGTYSVQDRGESFNGFDEKFRAYYTCYYWVRFEGPYLIHSQPYHLESLDLMDPRIGQNVSQGCVRMELEKAKWIYDNIPIGTTVVTY